jgi:hypothetical protein
MSQPKYSKKTSFSRDKKYAYCESDIAKNDKKIDDYKNVRGLERERNLKVANGTNETNEVSASENEANTSAITQEQFYFEKMNLIISGMPFIPNTMNNTDTILREFAPYGKIIYATQLAMDAQGRSNSKLVIDYWYDEPDIDMTFIVEVQTAILNHGKYNWFCCDNAQVYITKDPDQSVKDMGCKIVVEQP